MAASSSKNIATATAERLLPQSLDAERSALGSMILDRDEIGEVVQIIGRDAFFSADHQTIFDVIVDLYDQDQPLDLVLLREELTRRGQLDRIGGVSYLVTVVESVPDSSNAVYYARIVRDLSLLRMLISASSQIVSRAYQGREDPEELLEEAEKLIFEITGMKVSGQAVVLKELLHQTFKQIEQYDGTRVTGLTTSFPKLDDMLGGLQRGDMIILAARPSMGKSALALNIAEHIAADNHLPVAFFSVEMSAQQLTQRILCSYGKIDSQKLRRGSLDAQEHRDLAQAAQELESAPLFIDDSPGLSVLQLRAKARRLKLKHDIQCIVVDYLQLLSPSIGTGRRSENRQQEIAEMSRGLKALARELDIPVIALSQLNRSPEQREGGKPRMSDLRESGAIEQDADVVLLLHRECVYNDQAPKEQAELDVAKQRNGPTGAVQLTWNAACTRFGQAYEGFGPTEAPPDSYTEEAPF
ncbi:MAG: replicative DNA helicase [Actinobacteria bacterium]|nr:replicative DNA helicase [Actinomycetota bacterium]